MKGKTLLLKYINGSKGAIALFLAVLMTPFLSIAMLLVETGRYNSVISILDEAMGVSSTSLLANYDEYLQKRWGLLAIDQGVDIKDQYNEYLSINSGVMGDSLNLNKVSASGMYPLSDLEIMYNQILEFSKLNAPTTLVAEFLNLSDLIEKIKKFKSLGNIFSLITSGIDNIDATITLIEAADELKKYANNLYGYQSEYETRYTEFCTSVDNLIKALNEPRPDEEADQSAAMEYDNNIEKLRQKVDQTKDDYKALVSDIIDDLSGFQSAMKRCNDAIIRIKNNRAKALVDLATINMNHESTKKKLKDVNKTIKEMEEAGVNKTNIEYLEATKERSALEWDLNALQAQKGLAEANQNATSVATESWKQSFDAYSDEVISAYIKGFDKIESELDKFRSDSITEKSESINDDQYHNVPVGGYISAAEIDAYLAKQERELTKGSFAAMIKGVTTFINSIFKFKTFFDPALSAYIDTQYYQDTFGGLPGDESADGGVISIIRGIEGIVTSMNYFAINLGKAEFKKTLESLKKLLTSIKKLIDSIVQFAWDMAQNIIQIVTDRIYYNTYITYNLPCRTDCIKGRLSFEGMNGYNLTSESLPSQNILSLDHSKLDDLIAIFDNFKSYIEGTGDDITFSGAELEYVLFGSDSEIINQLYTFFALYLMRLLLDVPAILANAETQVMAAASTLGAPIVMFLLILAEPLVDTILLVNGEAVSFYKTTIYLTPTGLPKLIEKLVSVVKITTEQKDYIKEVLVGVFDETVDDYDYQKTLYDYQNRDSEDEKNKKNDKDEEGDGYISLDYRKHCFLLLLLTVTKEQQMVRLSNLIQMETLYYYNKQDAPYTFDLSKSFTFVETEVDVSVKQMLPSLADSSLFTITRKQYRGY